MATIAHSSCSCTVTTSCASSALPVSSGAQPCNPHHHTHLSPLCSLQNLASGHVCCRSILRDWRAPLPADALHHFDDSLRHHHHLWSHSLGRGANHQHLQQHGHPLLPSSCLPFPHSHSTQTTNEKVNRSRYWWMKGPDGRPKNRFDRGPLINLLEFLGCPCYRVDYMTIMTIDDSATAIDNNKSDHSTETRATELIAQTGTSSSPLPSPSAAAGAGATGSASSQQQQQQEQKESGEGRDATTSNPLNEHSHDHNCHGHEHSHDHGF
jgi:hypothetical protein